MLLETINYKFWLPFIVAIMSLLISFLQFRRNRSRSRLTEWEVKLERANEELQKCEDNLRLSGREKEELRKEKYALMEHITRLSFKNSNQENNN